MTNPNTTAADNPILEGYRKEAVIDGQGDNAEVYLHQVSAETDDVLVLDWPAHWPEYVSADFLRSEGFRVVRA